MKIPSLHGERQIAEAQNGRATDSFWLFLDSVQRWIRGNGTALYATSAERTTLSTRGYIDPKNVTDGSLLVETDTGLFYQWHGSSLSWIFIAGTQILSQPLPHGVTTTVHAPATGARDLVVILTQDGTGGGLVAFDTAGFSAFSNDIDTAAGTISVYRFVLNGAKYVQVGQQTTGMTA